MGLSLAEGQEIQPMPLPEPGAIPVLDKLRQEIIVAGYSQRTVSMYVLYAKDFISFFKKPADQAKRDDVMAYFAYLKEHKGLSNASLALVHSALKFFFRTCLKSNAIDDIKVPKKMKKLPVVLSHSEVKGLIEATKAGRNRLLVEFLYGTGVRVSEAVDLKVNDLELNQNTATVRGGKGGKDRLIVLPKKWGLEIKKYLARRKNQSEFAFAKKNGKQISTDTVQRIIKRASLKAGIAKHVTPHSLRHSFATHLLESGESIRKIQELLGHTNLSTTQIYTKVSTDELRKVSSPLDNL